MLRIKLPLQKKLHSDQAFSSLLEQTNIKTVGYNVGRNIYYKRYINNKASRRSRLLSYHSV